jgi:hypothetical protein
VEENTFFHFRMLYVIVGWHRMSGRDTCCGLTGNKVYPTGKGILERVREKDKKSDINIFRGSNSPKRGGNEIKRRYYSARNKF